MSHDREAASYTFCAQVAQAPTTVRRSGAARCGVLGVSRYVPRCTVSDVLELLAMLNSHPAYERPRPASSDTKSERLFFEYAAPRASSHNRARASSLAAADADTAAPAARRAEPITFEEERVHAEARLGLRALLACRAA